jgi:hypothetical protein
LADLRIVEDLAQFYTERVVVSLANEQPLAEHILQNKAAEFDPLQATISLSGLISARRR